MLKSPAEIYSEAAQAAITAAKTCIPTPMGVFQSDIIGNRLGPTEIVSEGLCGFAYVRIKPARGKFIKYLKDNNIGHLSMYGGYMISMSMFTSSQSVDRKVAAAETFVRVLKQNGIEKVWCESRLD